MTRRRARSPLPAFALVWLGLFAFVYSAGEAVGVWRELPPGSFQDAELAAGFAGLIALIFVLVRRGTTGSPLSAREAQPPRPEERGESGESVAG